MNAPAPALPREAPAAASRALPPISPAEQERVAALVRQCVPLRHPAFGKLLRLLSIELSREVPTAAVTTGSRSRLLINPDFLAERCRTEEHLAMLVMHELYHVLLGHTRIYRRPTLAANWAFDCIINAQLCRLHPGPGFTSFFRSLAAPDGPWSLIAPPPGWPDAPRYAGGALGDVHRRLYDDDGVTTEELFALLERTEIRLDPEDIRRLLGSHESDSGSEAPNGDPLRLDPDLLSEVRRIVARWPMVTRRGGVDDGGEPELRRDTLRRHPRARRALRRLLRKAAFGAGGGPPRRTQVMLDASTVLPQARDRRAQLQRLMGNTPLLWQGQMRQDGRQDSGQVNVYLDVSGSMASWLPLLLDALSSAAALVRWPVFGFSTQVHPITRAELAAGSYRSTGGTDIACVAQHLVDTGAKRALIVTDGEVQEIPARLFERLRRSGPCVQVGLIDGGRADFCARLGWSVTALPPLDFAAA